ncbi:MAG: hypothetical protein RL037_1901 [Bacteroidota bacterium]
MGIKIYEVMAAILYHLIVFPLSFLPLFILYRISDFLFVLFYYIIPYRKKVVQSNLKNSFPNASPKQLRKIEKDFYRHFCKLLVEGIKNLSMSQKELQQRLKVSNPELMEALLEKGKSVILISGHYGNWEWLITSQSTLFKHKAFGIGMPLTSNFWNTKLNERRSRHGMTVLDAKNYKETLKNSPQPFAVLTLGDQAPPTSEKAYWTNFLNQDTPVLFGTEFMANEFDAAVVYFSIQPIKPGFYTMTLHLVTEEPRQHPFGFITEKHTEMLERDIQKAPAFWLWSHKRWKRKQADDLIALRYAQQEAFDKRFRS